MKVSCILTSFNRPTWVKDSLRSIENQTHPDIQLIVIDESDEFEILDTLKKFSFPELIVRRSEISPEIRRLENRLSVNCNTGLGLATGDLVCFLADDDYYYPQWFEKAVQHFEKHPDHQAAFGKLVYSYDRTMSFSPNPDPSVIRFYKDIVKDPYGKLDHNQVIHRNFKPHFRWPTSPLAIGADAHYFRDVSVTHPFHPIDAFACVKRLHKKGLLESQQIYINGFMEGLRE